MRGRRRLWRYAGKDEEEESLSPLMKAEGMKRQDVHQSAFETEPRFSQSREGGDAVVGKTAHVERKWQEATQRVWQTPKSPRETRGQRITARGRASSVWCGAARTHARAT